MPSAQEDNAALIKCSYCPARLPRDDWPTNPSTGKAMTRCRACSAKNSKRTKERRAKTMQAKLKGLQEPGPSGSVHGAANESELDRSQEATPDPECDCVQRQQPCARGQPAPPPIGKDSMNMPTSWEAFRLLLSTHGHTACDISALVALEHTVARAVDVAGEAHLNRPNDKILAGEVVQLVLEELGYRFNLHTTDRRQNATRFTYYCAQREGSQTPSQKGKPRAGSANPPKHERATKPMERWHCEGWLSVSIVAGGDAVYARIHLYHGLAHAPYNRAKPAEKRSLDSSENENGGTAKRARIE